MAVPTVDLSDWNAPTFTSGGVVRKLLDPQHIHSLSLYVAAQTSEYRQILNTKRWDWTPVPQAMKIIENPPLPLGLLQLDSLASSLPHDYTWGDFLNVNKTPNVRPGWFVISATGYINLGRTLNLVQFGTALDPDAWPEIDPKTPLRDVLNNSAFTSKVDQGPLLAWAPNLIVKCKGTVDYQ